MKTGYRKTLDSVRKEATHIIVNAMGEHNYLHFPLMQVSWLKSLTANPQTCLYTTKGNLELWSTDSLVELASFLEGPEYWPQIGDLVSYDYDFKPYTGKILHIDQHGDAYTVESGEAASVRLSRSKLTLI